VNVIETLNAAPQGKSPTTVKDFVEFLTTIAQRGAA